MVETLKRIVVSYTGTPIKLKDLDLTISQHNNAQKLKHFDLVMHNESGYIPSPKAISFVAGDIPVLDVAISYRNKTVDESHKAWYGVKKNYKRINDFFPINYQQRHDYTAITA